MAANYTITAIDGGLITVVFEDKSWAQVRVTADMTQQDVDDLVYQFAPKPRGTAPSFLTPGQKRRAVAKPEPESGEPLEQSKEPVIPNTRIEV